MNEFHRAYLKAWAEAACKIRASEPMLIRQEMETISVILATKACKMTHAEVAHLSGVYDAMKESMG